jgi:hypothetical protein
MSMRFVAVVLVGILATSCSTRVVEPGGGATPVFNRLYGTVSTSTAPVAGATIQVRSPASQACQGVAADPSLVPADTVSHNDGSFSVWVIGGFTAGTYCVHVTAIRQGASGVDSVAVAGLSVPFNLTPDSTRVTGLTFP